MKSAPASFTILATGWQANRSSPRNTGRNGARRAPCLPNQRLAALRSQSCFSAPSWGAMNSGISGTTLEWPSATTVAEQIVAQKHGAQRREACAMLAEPAIGGVAFAVLLLGAVLGRDEFRHQRHDLGMAERHHRRRTDRRPETRGATARGVRHACRTSDWR